MSDVTTRLILNIQGQDQLKQLSTEHEKLREHVVGLIKSHKDFDDALKDPAILTAAENLKKVEEQIEKIDGTLRNTTRNWGNAAVQWSRAAQDFQAAGFAGIANNMELMVSSLGGPAILAGVATIAGTFGPLIVRKIASMFEEGVKEGASHLDELEKKLKELEGKKSKVWIDYQEIQKAKEEIDGLKKAHEELDRVIRGQSKAEAESGKRVKESIAETPEARETLASIVAERAQKAIAEDPKAEEVRSLIRETTKNIKDLAEGTGEFTEMAGIDREFRRAREAESLEGLQGRLQLISSDVTKQVEADMAKTVRAATQGTGQEQLEAQQALIRQFSDTGTEAGFRVATQMRAVPAAEMGRQAREKEEAEQAKKEEQEEKRRQHEEDAEMRRNDADLDKAMREAAQEEKTKERDKNRQEREEQRAADERTRARDQMAREAMRDPRLKVAVETEFMQGGRSEEIGPRLGKFLGQQGLAPEAEAPFVGAAAAGQVKEDLNRRLSGYVAQGMDRTQAFAAIQEEVLGEMQKLDQKVMQMEQSLIRQQGMMQGFKQTRLNRGDMP